MLTYSLTKNHNGILLSGDYQSLRALHEVLHEVNEHSPLVRDKEGVLLSLAYDARKAYEQQRKVIPAPIHYPEWGVRFGVEVPWPDLLVQSRVLRVSIAYMNSTKWQQAVAYNLEAVIEAALKEDFGTQSDALIEQWQQINPAHPWPEEKLKSRSAAFASWTKAERRKRILGLLSSLDPMYPFFYEHGIQSGNSTLLSPQELDAFGQSPMA